MGIPSFPGSWTSFCLIWGHSQSPRVWSAWTIWTSIWMLGFEQPLRREAVWLGSCLHTLQNSIQLSLHLACSRYVYVFWSVSITNYIQAWMRRHFRSFRHLFQGDFGGFLRFVVAHSGCDTKAKEHFQYAVSGYKFEGITKLFKKSLNAGHRNKIRK